MGKPTFQINCLNLPTFFKKEIMENRKIRYVFFLHPGCVKVDRWISWAWYLLIAMSFLKILPYLSQATLMVKNYPLDHFLHLSWKDPNEVLYTVTITLKNLVGSHYFSKLSLQYGFDHSWAPYEKYCMVVRGVLCTWLLAKNYQNT